MNKFCGAVLLSLLLIITVPLSLQAPELQHQSSIFQAPQFFVEGNDNPASIFDVFSTSIRTRVDPAFIDVGDFNNDSLKDIVVGSLTNRTIELFFQKTDGTFNMTPSKTIKLSFTITGLAVGDLDKDKTDDIIVTSATTQKVYLLYQKTGFNLNSKDARPNPYGVIIADFDRDGHNDFAYVSYNSSSSPNCTFVVHLWRNNFFPENYVRLDTPAGLFRATLISTTDINHDGYPDLAIGDSNFSKIAIYKGEVVSGVLSWSLVQVIGSYSLKNPIEMQFVQLDLIDSDELVVLSKGNNKTIVYKYDETSGQYNEYITKEGLIDPATNTMLDTNGDLIPDLVTISKKTGHVEIFLTRLNFPYGNRNFTFPSNAYPIRAITGDINNDGLADLIISANATSYNGSVTIYYGLRSGFLSNANENVFFDADSFPTSFVQGDFDGDGIVEIGALCIDNKLKFVKIGTSERKTKITGLSPFDIKSSDLTNDTLPDIVISNSGSNNITLYFGGNDFFQNEEISLSLQLSSPFSDPKGISIDDMDGDGAQDIVIACRGGIVIFFNLGQYPYFDSSHSLNFSVYNSDFTYVVTGNFNVGYETIMGWGATKDIAAYNSSSNKLEIYFQDNISHSFSVAWKAELLPDTSSACVWLGSGKIDNDELYDLVVPLANGKLVTYIQKTGLQNGFSDGSPSRISYNVENGIFRASIGDLDDDGKDEIAITARRIGMVTIIKLNGSSYANLISFSSGAGLGDLLVADLNKDLREDLLISSPLSSSVSINYQNNLPPRALAVCITPPPLKEGNVVRFDGRNSTDSYSDLAFLNYSWSFGDGQFAYGGLVTHIFENNGSYQVSLRVTDRGGLMNQYNLSVVILDLAPSASFTINPQTVFEGSLVEFIDNSISFPDPIVTRRWEFGDGTVDQGNNSSTSHIYMRNGTYCVNLTITDKDGSTSLYSHYLVVLDNAPIAAFELSSTSPMENTTVYFIDKSTSYPDTIVSWYWDFGDQSTSDERNPTHIYLQNGTYHVSLTVRDADGSTNSISLTIEVIDTGPSVSFSFNPTSPNEGQQISFTDKSTAFDGIVSWSWDFGDGSSSSDKNPIHYYANNGTYRIRLTVVDGDGSINFSEMQIAVKDTSPSIAKMTAYSSSGQMVEDAEITIEVTVIANWESTKNFRYWWDFNYSGSFSTDKITQSNKSTNSFSKKGTYVIAVRVWDSDSYTEESITIEIANVKPSAKFSYQLVQSGEIRFDASLTEDTPSDMPTLKYRWNFNDGSNWSYWNNSPIIFHLFENDGNYSVVLEVIDDDGATSRFTSWVVVDREVPIVGNIIVIDSIVGKPIIIRASINDNVGIRNATLFYKVGNVTFSTTMLKTEGTGTVWEGQIKALNATTIITFWIEAIDTSGNKFTTGQWEIVVTEGAIPSSLWIAGLGISGVVLGGVYVYLRRFSTVVDEVFVIYEDGCLIAHDTRRLKPGMDDDVLSSMLVAIQDFVKTAFKDENATALKRLDFGEKKILVEKGEKIYLAAVLHGKYDAKITQKMLKILNEIHRDYGSVFAQWDGDLEKVRGVRDKAHLLFAREWKVPVELFRSIRKRLSLDRSIKIECPICGEEISSKISKCPSCGAELSLADISELEDIAKKINQEEEKSGTENENTKQDVKQLDGPHKHEH